SPQALDEILHNESLTLADLDRIAQGANPVSGTLSLIFESSVSPSDLALAFLANTDVDNALIAKSAQGELATLLVENFGLPEPRSQALSDLRTQFTRHVLLTDFRASLPGDIAYEILATVPFPRVRWQTEACQRLAARWRDSATHRAAYKAAACQVEHDYGIHALDLAWDAWQRVQTFSVVETLLLENAERLILSGAYAEALALVEQRRSSFWNANERENDLRWSLIHAAASLLADCPKIQEGLDKRPWSASEMIIAYAQGTYEAIRPWCLLDTFHRHMERLYTSLAPTPTLNHVVAKARQAYTTVMQQVAEHFGNALTKAQFQIPEVAQQTNIFREQVAPRLQHGKVAYIVMDALRFEMARELLNDLTEASQKILIPALAAVPTLTSVGMAALLPGAERGLGLIEVSGQLATDINGHLLKMRGDRVEYLTQRGGYETEVFTLAEALKLGRIVKEQINRAQLVVVTSQEIDHVAEQQAPYLARGAMDELLSHVKRALHNLAEIGVSTFIIASDHGFLFGDELASDILVDPPGGHT
ncbi:MAG: PglZ domain-containing protein, partial [Chloroflexi bacterium]|nr:PglZ domain-containing protein [Chloroflexota bacterium]